MGVSDLFSRRATAGSASPSSASTAHAHDEHGMPLAFLGAIVESSDDAIIGMTLEGLIISWNEAATRIFGHKQSDAVGQHITALIPPEFRDEEQRILDKVRRGERVDHFETTRATKDGRRVRVSLTLSPVRDATGLVIAASETARDIEAQKRAERATAQLAAIVESSEDAIVSKTLEGIVQSWNASAQRIFGYTPEEMIGKPITTIIPPEHHSEESMIIQRIRSGQPVEPFDTTRIAKDGRRIAISLTVSPIRNARGEVIGASKIARDITQRKRAERELVESRRRLASEAAALVRLSEASTRLWQSQSLASGLDEILRTVKELTGASKGNVQLVNASRNTLSIVAYDGFDAAFLAAFEHISIDDRRSACGRALATGGPVVIEDVLADPAYADYKDVARSAGYRSVVSVPLFAADRAKLGAISVHFPSPHRPTEAEMRRLQLYCRQASDFIQRIHLEHTLRRREEALQEADSRKNEFLALLAHELRNPIAPIRYALAMARKPGISAEQRMRAEDIIDRQAAHMGRLLDDLLDVSRITRGSLELRKSPTTLDAAVSTAVESAQPFMDAKHHALKVDLPDHTVRLEADPARLAQILSNLLINAAKFTPEGGRIELEATNGPEEVVVTVRDNGIGIGPELMPRLFTLLAQAQPALDRAENGLGVGLALVRGLVHLHGGTVEAKSAGPGRGSEFIVRLPVGTASEHVADDTHADTSRSNDLRILVVDDNRDAADSCAMLLELSGHRVRTAYNGTQALRLGENLLPHVVLLDIGLPDLNGYEVARRIRATPWGAKLPLVAVTGWGKEEDRERAFAAGFDHHLTKPVAPEAVASLVAALSQGARPA
jgi:PAS domain S-box-containing protein